MAIRIGSKWRDSVRDVWTVIGESGGYVRLMNGAGFSRSVLIAEVKRMEAVIVMESGLVLTRACGL